MDRRDGKVGSLWPVLRIFALTDGSSPRSIRFGRSNVFALYLNEVELKAGWSYLTLQ